MNKADTELLTPTKYKNTGSRHLFRQPWILSLIGIFAIAFCLRVWYAFSVNHTRTYAIGDAYEYLNDAQALQSLPSLIKQLMPLALPIISSTATPAMVHKVQTLLQPLSGLSASGPVFPTFLLASYAVCGAKFNLNNPVPPVLWQCFISALSSMLTALIARRAFGFTVGCIGGILAALYPPFIINSGQLSTETFSTFLLCLVVR